MWIPFLKLKFEITMWSLSTSSDFNYDFDLNSSLFFLFSLRMSSERFCFITSSIFIIIKFWISILIPLAILSYSVYFLSIFNVSKSDLNLIVTQLPNILLRWSIKRFCFITSPIFIISDFWKLILFLHVNLN
jgi:hypothetical protein